MNYDVLQQKRLTAKSQKQNGQPKEQTHPIPVQNSKRSDTPFTVTPSSSTHPLAPIVEPIDSHTHTNNAQAQDVLINSLTQTIPYTYTKTRINLPLPLALSTQYKLNRPELLYYNILYLYIMDYGRRNFDDAGQTSRMLGRIFVRASILLPGASPDINTNTK
jgi:hypothetical protein